MPESMTMQELYDEMKSALQYLDVGFHDMKDVDVSIDGNGRLVFACGRRETTLEIPEYE